jgi:hypothetical protein
MLAHRRRFMGYRLAPDQYAAVFDDRAVVLDVRADRYRLLKSTAASGLRALESGDEEHPAYAHLVSIGILEAGERDTTAVGIRPFIASALERSPVHAHGPGFLAVASALLRSMTELKRAGLRRTLQRTAQRSLAGADGSAALVPIAQAYARQRSRLPLHQICLPDSLALHRILAARGLRSSLVIGVRLDPFMAHCWLQADDLLLNDGCDHVSGFTPILSL